MEWTDFVSCGKTANSSLFEDRTVSCTQVSDIIVVDDFIFKNSTP